MTHELKTVNPYFQQVWDGNKNFEIRYNKDRAFQKGDRVHLLEYDSSKNTIESKKYTGRVIRAEIGFVSPYEQKENYVVFSLLNVETYE